jgi:hypothetical protein
LPAVTTNPATNSIKCPGHASSNVFSTRNFEVIAPPAVARVHVQTGLADSSAGGGATGVLKTIPLNKGLTNTTRLTKTAISTTAGVWHSRESRESACVAVL